MSWWVIRTVAKKEAKTNLRSPSFLSIALLLLILNFAVISFSVSFSGFEGQADPRAMLLSLINLQMYIVPLLALIVSYDGLLRERELGTLDLLLSDPLEFSDMVIGKWLALMPRVLLLDEPTRGIDVGAKEEIYRLMEALAQQGMAILFVSSEMEEIIEMSDRTLVLHEGAITGELARDALSEEAIMQLATGGTLVA